LTVRPQRSDSSQQASSKPGAVQFQDVNAVYPAEVQAAAKRFAHLKATVHAVLFLFRPSGSGVLDFSLQQVLVWNRALTTEAGARPLNDHLCAAITPLK
jgi:hypothetical protein